MGRVHGASRDRRGRRDVRTCLASRAAGGPSRSRCSQPLPRDALRARPRRPRGPPRHARRPGRRRPAQQHTPLVPAAFGAPAAPSLHAGSDWDWELAGVTLAAVVCGAALVVAARPRRRRVRAPDAAARRRHDRRRRARDRKHDPAARQRRPRREQRGASRARLGAPTRRTRRRAGCRGRSSRGSRSARPSSGRARPRPPGRASSRGSTSTRTTGGSGTTSPSPRRSGAGPRAGACHGAEPGERADRGVTRGTVGVAIAVEGPTVRGR